jgi:thioredoxin reductase (NADPH)
MSDQFAAKPQQGQPWDVAIIGSGPAGLTAAIYTTRGAASSLVFAGDQWGGQLMLTTAVDNFPGFPQGIEGPDLMQAMRSQAERFGAEFVNSAVSSVDLNSHPFKLTSNNNTYQANSIIIATGAETRWLGIPGEDKLRGRGISSCAPCDAPFFKDKKVMVIGGGDAAMEEALVLTKYASDVTIVHRRDSFKASEAMQKRVKDNTKIKIIYNTEAQEFVGDQKLDKIILKNNQSGEVQDFVADGVFVAIGHIPSTYIFKDQLELDEKGYIKRHESDNYKMLTSVDGVFVAGDVFDYHYQQAVTAAAFGCMAAMESLKYLDKHTPSW